MSLTMPAATTAVIEAAPEERAGLASGTINAARQVGGLLGIALMGSLASTNGHFSDDSHAALAVGAAAFLLALVLAALTAPAQERSGGSRLLPARTPSAARSGSVRRRAQTDNLRPGQSRSSGSA